MKLSERAVVFACRNEQLVGVLAEAAPSHGVGVLVVVGGPQYRAGSHRQFVLLARRLAAEGVPVLRFDCRGKGDATGSTQSFEEVGPDIAAAIDTMLAACPDVEKVVLWGLCDAAAAALSYWNATADRRVAGMALLNPWVRSQAGFARVQIKHYYRKRVFQQNFWKKLFRGGVDVSEALREFGRSLATVLAHDKDHPALNHAVAFQDRMADGLRSFPGPVLLILSIRDLTAREFLDYAQSHPRWAGLLDRPNILRVELADADHTFSSAYERGRVEETTLDWLRDSVLSASR